MSSHTCDERTIDYSTVDHNFIRCTACPRRWVFNQYRGWIMQPSEPRPDRHEPDYWFSRAEPQPVPTEEQVAQRRERRLQRLHRIEVERFESLAESDKALERHKKRGGGVLFDFRTARAAVSERTSPYVIGLHHSRSILRRLRN